MKRVAIIGTGYVGLTSGAAMAHLGHQVLCADLDSAKVERLNRGEIHIFEPGLEDLVAAGLANGRLRFVTGAAEAATGCHFAFLCVQTPSMATGQADLTFVLAAVSELAEVLPAGAIVVDKSTVPVGTARRVSEVLQRPDVAVVSNPEFLREGTAVSDFLKPDRIVVGSHDLSAAQAVADLYRTLGAPTIITGAESAELIKYASNSYLAVKLSYVNAIAAICEGVGADVVDVLKGMSFDPRIGADALRPGPGWGGSCLPKDTAALLHTAGQVGYDFHLLRSAVEANHEQRARVVRRVIDAAGGNVRGVRIAVWGLTFKANTDDLRDSPALAVVRDLLADGAEIVAHDPQVTVPPLDGIALVPDALAACDGAAVLVLLTEWPVFAAVDLTDVRSRMVGDHIVDARNLLAVDQAERVGLKYVGIGRACGG